MAGYLCPACLSESPEECECFPGTTCGSFSFSGKLKYGASCGEPTTAEKVKEAESGVVQAKAGEAFYSTQREAAEKRLAELKAAKAREDAEKAKTPGRKRADYLLFMYGSDGIAMRTPGFPRLFNSHKRQNDGLTDDKLLVELRDVLANEFDKAIADAKAEVHAEYASGFPINGGFVRTGHTGYLAAYRNYNLLARLGTHYHQDPISAAREAVSRQGEK